MIPALIGLAASVAPSLVGMFAGDEAEELAGKVADAAKAVTGADSEEAAAQALQADPELLAEFRRHLADVELERYREDTKRLRAVNRTMGAEYGSNDAYVRRWRPTFGYAVALSWVVLFLALAAGAVWAVVARPQDAGAIIAALGQMVSATGMLWSVALAVLGVSVWQRSKDKRAARGAGGPDGQDAPGGLGDLAESWKDALR
jgi:hypothetical protein